MTTLVGFAAPTYSNDISESAGSLTHNLTLSAPSSQTVTVTVRGFDSTSPGFAGSADLGVADQIITFAPGQTTASFTTPILEDSLYEGYELYQFTIISATGAEIDLTNTNARYLTGNILDNDQPTNPLVGFAAPTYSNDVSESAGSLTHNLTLSAPSSQTVTVTVRGGDSTSAGFAGSADLGIADQIITFAPGQTTASFTTPILKDSLYEGNEFYQFTIISATGAEIDLTNTNARYLTGNILDNDSSTTANPTLPLTVRFAAPNGGNDVSESAGSLTHTLTLSAPSSQTVTVTVRGGNGGSAGSADLGLADQVITFAPGQTTATFTTAIHEDSLYEGSEMYYFEIISATGAEIDLASGARSLSGNILDNDQPASPTVRFAAPNGGNDVSESAGSLTHTLTLSAPSSQTVTVTVRGGNGGSAGSADLGLADQVITFAPGQTTATFTTAIHEDSLYEGSEMYYFEIISATGAEIDLASGARSLSGNILDNDQPASPTVRFAAPNGGNDVSESAGSLTHTLTLSAPSSQTVTVTVRGGNGGSAGSADLGLADQVITFAPGQTTATFTTAIHEDSLYEGSEMYYFEIISATGAEIDLASGARSLSGNILDDDQPGFDSAPVVANAIADQSSPEDTAWNFTIPANVFSDVDGDELAFTANLSDGGVLPAWLAFDAATRTFSGTPPVNFNGQVAIKATVSDGLLSASDTFTLTIAPVNDPLADFTLTTGSDTVTGTAANDTVYATAATLNAGESLTGGAGTDVLALVGSGTFRIDQLASFTGFERIRLDNATSYPANLTLGNQPIEVDATGSLSIQVNSPSNWNGSNIINGDASQPWFWTTISFQNYSLPAIPVTYDLTSNTFSHVNISAGGDLTTLLINNAVTAGVEAFSGYGLTKLVTAGSTLDLSHTTVSGLSVTSTNALGTAFTVGDLGTALQIAGGSGQDSIIATGFTFTAEQRNTIFATASVENIVDQTGTYAAPPPSPDVVGLTTGNDTIVTPFSGSTVYATAATLNAGDSLTGGAGTDVLALVGSGTFRIDQLATFTGFERIRLDNATSYPANLTLGNQPIEVDATGSLSIQVNSPSNWNGSNIINGDASQPWFWTTISFQNYSLPAIPVTYDLTSNTFSHVNISAGGDLTTLLINNAVTAGVEAFSGYGLTKLVTAGSTLDLSHTTVSGLSVTSTNALGTAFTVGDLGTALQIAGGSGQDSIIATGFTFTAEQRNTIFATASVENIVDQTGTYAAPPPSPDVVGLTTGNDTIVTPFSGSTVYATAATLNAGDSLTGGAGTDVLALVGSGTFRIDQLATFTGFERIRLDNATSYPANLTLGNQPIEVDATGSLSIQVNSPSNWNGSNIINGDASQPWFWTTISFQNYSLPAIPVTYDLTSNTFSHVNISAGGDLTTLLINNAVTAGVEAFSGYGLTKLVTAGSTLDLSHTTVSGLSVTSTNALGTAFTVGDLGTALQIAGGSGQDSIIATGFTFTAEQRNTIFATASIENIVDQTGIYTVDNAPPTITSNDGSDTAAVSLAENTTAATIVTATDPDVGQTLNYSIIDGGDASKFTIDTSTGALSFITAPNFEASTDTDGNNVYDVTVQVSDGHGGVDTQAIAVTVTDDSENTVPIIASNGGGTTAVVSLAENTTAVTTVAAIDPDVTQTLSYSIIDGADASKFAIDTSTGALSFITAPNFEASTDTDGNNVYDVTVQVSDGNGGVDTQGIAVTVTDVFENTSPIITSNGEGDTAAISIAENTTAVTTVTATDPDPEQTRSYSIIGGADGSKFTINSTTGALSFITTPDFEAPADTGDNNVYDVTVQVSDANGGVDTQAIAITVNDVFENSSPIITSNEGGKTAAVSLAENTTAVTTVTATDRDVTQTLSYSISGGADASKFTIGATTGALSFITTPDFEAPADTGGNNVYDVTVQVSDGNSGVDTQAIAVTVEDVIGSTVNGTSQAQTLTGTGDVDFLYGMGGNDNLQGQAGNDYLDGGSGKDTMTGGAGNDTYIVDNSGDVVIENSGNGTDTVLSSISLALGANVEWLTLSGSGRIDGTGNALSNNLTGNSGNNILSGLAGNDLLNGGAGNDTLVGGLGADLLTGGIGADRFAYSAFAESTVDQLDVIQDFVHGADMIDFAAIDANAAKKGNQAFAFAGQNEGVVANSVTWYESGGNTFVQADVNGNTTADITLELTGINLNLTASDFLH